MSTRANNPMTAVRVVIMQRLHQDDLTGHILEKAKEAGADQYELVCLPMYYEPHRFVSSIGLKDPRTKPKELLWPKRFPLDKVRATEVTLGERGAAGQLQQRPAPEAGFIFRRDWWGPTNRYSLNDPVRIKRVVARWIAFDTAMKDARSHDYTAQITAELYEDYRLGIREATKKKLQFPQLSTEIEHQAIRWNGDGKLRGIVIEDRSSGISVLQTLTQGSIEGVSDLLVSYSPGVNSKTIRARQASLWCDRGCILLPMPESGTEWLFDFEEDLFNFPAIKHDDVIDTFSMIVLYLEHIIAHGWQLRTAPKT